jgi:hypothetical protein
MGVSLASFGLSSARKYKNAKCHEESIPLGQARSSRSSGIIIFIIDYWACGWQENDKTPRDKHEHSNDEHVNNNAGMLKLLHGRINSMEQAQHVMALSSILVQWLVVSSLLSSLDMFGWREMVYGYLKHAQACHTRLKGGLIVVV